MGHSGQPRRLLLSGGVLLVAFGALAITFASVSGIALQPSGPTVPECTGAKSLDFGCFARRYEAMTRLMGADAALADLDRAHDASGFVGAACHQLTHAIGRTAGERAGLAAFQQGSDVCASGYYHGIVESVMTSLGPDHVVDRAPSVCADLREQSPYSFLHYNCIHGMGHGFMATLESDVFRSLPGCDALTDAWERQHCYSGVFMENLSAMSNLVRPSRELRPDTPLYPCTEVASQYKSECYLKQTAYAVYVRNDDFGAVFRLCRDGPDVDYRDACYQGVGGDAAIMSSKYVTGEVMQAATTRELCFRGPDEEAQRHCVVGAINTIVRDLAGDDAQARALCSAIQETELAAICETTREEAGKKVATFAIGHHDHFSRGGDL